MTGEVQNAQLNTLLQHIPPSLIRGLATIALLTLACSSWAGPGGDGHSHEAPASAVSTASPRVAMTGEIYDAVGVLDHGRLVIYVDRLSDNAPVLDATLEVTLAGAKTVLDKVAPDGTYALAADALARGSAYEVLVSIQGPDGDDLVGGTLDLTSADAPALVAQWQMPMLSPVLAGVVFVLGLVTGAGVMHLRQRRALVLVLAGGLAALALPAWAGPGGDGHSHGDESGATVASNAPHRLPDGSVFLPKPTQRLLEVRTTKAELSVVRKTISMPGRVIASPNQSGVVQSINGGRVAVAEGKLPALGQKVSKGELLAIVEPPVNAADNTTIADRAGEISQLITLAEIRLQRLAPLAEKNAIPKTQVVDLEAELAALRTRQSALRTQRRQSEELRAPVDGEIAAMRAVAGQVVSPQDQIFHIIDPQAMWVEGFVFGDLDASTLTNAVAVTSHHKKQLALRFEGVGRVLQQHTVQLQFSIENPPSNLMVGEPVTVLAQSPVQLSGVVLPRASVIRAANGQMIVWHHASSERFVPLPVRIEPLDGERIVVVAGVSEGQRIVVAAAELINQVR
jgi:RND family efflux transporter MFP subunit